MSVVELIVVIKKKLRTSTTYIPRHTHIKNFKAKNQTQKKERKKIINTPKYKPQIETKEQSQKNQKKQFNSLQKVAMITFAINEMQSMIFLNNIWRQIRHTLK